LKRLLEPVCAALAGLALFAIMGLTLADVLGRKLFGHSLPGALELTEIGMVVLIFAALPLVSLLGEHVVFDSLDPLLSPPLRRLQRRAVETLCALTLAAMAALMAAKAGDLAQYGDTTAQLKLPLWWFVAGMAGFCAVAAAVHGWRVFVPQTDRAAIDAATVEGGV
jgi:TRAP-type C4-dicarboxylate transport system permease small subunit